ncbi:MAG: M23 family metallopeptidase [Psychroflexus maritimus]
MSLCFLNSVEFIYFETLTTNSKNMFRFILSSFFFFPLLIFSQINVPQEYFKKPMDIPLVLSGTFGELRSNHFHAGIDIKTNQEIGLPVKASAEGYISRIKIQRFGYGRALYIQHPNGYQSVYAHLSKFNEEIEAFVKQKQYEEESYEIELFPEENQFQVKQGEIIALSGNSGSSGGPHLHFEIRDSSSRPMNPFLFGFEEIEDTRKPRIGSLWAYTFGNESQVGGIQGRQRIQLFQTQGGDYKTNPIKAKGKIGFGLSTDDQLNLAINRNGVYKIESFLNGAKHFELVFNLFSFAETRYLNSAIDYGYFKEHKKKIQKLFIPENNPLSVYTFNNKRGVLEILTNDFSFNYEIKIYDFAGNTRRIQIPIEYSELPITQVLPKEETPYFAYAQQATVFEDKNIDVYIPKGALYEDTYLKIEFSKNAVNLHDYRTPLHKNIQLGFDLPSYSDLSQAYIANVMPWGTKFYVNTKQKSNRLTATTKTFGKFELAFDRTPPTINPLNFRNKKWMSNYNTLEVEIDDKETGIQDYRATLNGDFLLMEYDYKTKQLTHYFEEGVFKDGKNDFKLIVTDKVGNTTIFEAEIYRKN